MISISERALRTDCLNCEAVHVKGQPVAKRKPYYAPPLDGQEPCGSYKRKAGRHLPHGADKLVFPATVKFPLKGSFMFHMFPCFCTHPSHIDHIVPLCNQVGWCMGIVGATSQGQGPNVQLTKDRRNGG